MPDRTRKDISRAAVPIRSLPFAAGFAAVCGLLQLIGVPVGGLAVLAGIYGVGVFLFSWVVVVIHDVQTLIGPSPRLFSLQLRFWSLLSKAVFRPSEPSPQA